MKMGRRRFLAGVAAAACNPGAVYCASPDCARATPRDTRSVLATGPAAFDTACVGVAGIEGTVLAPLVRMPVSGNNPELKKMVTLAWNGAAFDYDTQRFYLTVPGGHADWYPNESFVIDLAANRSARLHDMTPYPPEFDGGTDAKDPSRPAKRVYVYTDGKPASRHTYAMPIWLPKQQRVLMASGACFDKGGRADRYCGWLDPRSGQWEHKNLWPFHRSGMAAAYDFKRDRIVCGRSTQGLWTYDPATDKATEFPRGPDSYSADIGVYVSFQVDPADDYLYAINRGGFFPNDEARKADLLRIRLGRTERQSWERVSVKGDTSGLKGKNPGFEYDSDLRAFVLWDSDHPDRVAILHLADMRMEYRAIALPSGVEHTVNGVWGRFRRLGRGRYALMTSPFEPVQRISL
jgi:hypothetical protein